MRMKSGKQKATAEKVVKDIRRKTRRLHTAEEKIRIVLVQREKGQIASMLPKTREAELSLVWQDGGLAAAATRANAESQANIYSKVQLLWPPAPKRFERVVEAVDVCLLNESCQLSAPLEEAFENLRGYELQNLKRRFFFGRNDFLGVQSAGFFEVEIFVLSFGDEAIGVWQENSMTNDLHYRTEIAPFFFFNLSIEEKDLE